MSGRQQQEARAEPTIMSRENSEKRVHKYHIANKNKKQKNMQVTLHFMSYCKNWHLHIIHGN